MFLNISNNLAFGSPPNKQKVVPDYEFRALSRNQSPDFSHLTAYAYFFGIVAIIVAIWSIASMIKSKNRGGGMVLSIILSSCIVVICVYILCMDNYLKTHKPKIDIVFKDGVGLVYESNAQIYKDDISSNSRLLITCSEWITEDVRIFSAYRYQKHDYIDDEEDFSIHVLVPLNPNGETGNKSRMFKVSLADVGVIEPFDIKLESENANGIQAGYFFRIADFVKLSNSPILSAVFESPNKLGEQIHIDKVNVGILEGQVKLIKERLDK